MKEIGDITKQGLNGWWQDLSSWDFNGQRC